MVALTDARGWVLLQERDEKAPFEPNRWCLVGGGIEDGEAPAAAAYRELEEETGIVCDDLVPLGQHELPCDHHGQDVVHLFTAPTSVPQEDVVCNEGRQMLFVEPAVIPTLDLARSTRLLLPLVLGQAAPPAGPGS